MGMEAMLTSSACLPGRLMLICGAGARASAMLLVLQPAHSQGNVCLLLRVGRQLMPQ